MAPQPAPSEQSLGYLLADAVRSARRDFSRRAEGLQLTPALARLLYYIQRRPGSHQTELAQQLEVTPVTLGRMVDRLAAHGHVERVDDAGDRRAVRIYVAPGGEPLLERVGEIRRQTESRMTRGLSAEEQAQLISLLARICDNLSDHGA